MKVKFYPRESVITATSTQYDVVVLEAVNDLYDKVGDNPKLRRNPNLDAQLVAVRKFGVPIIFRIVVNAQWYSDCVQQGLEDKTSWQYWMNKYLLDDVSNVLQSPHRAHGFLVTAVPSKVPVTTSRWVRNTMQFASTLIFEKWKLPVWYEFTSTMMNTTWDKAGGTYGQMQALLDNEEWVNRGENPFLPEGELTFPDTTLSYLPEIGTPEVPQPEGGFILPIEPLSQLDERWKDIQLGTSASTIGGYGCLITAVSMMLNYYGYDITPDILNDELNSHAGYSNGNLLVWGSIPVIYPDVTYDGKYAGARNDIIDARLDDGRPVLVHVDYNPDTAPIEQHWVLIVGKNSDGYIINDPRDGLQLSFVKRYGDSTAKIYSVASYGFAGEIPEQETPPVISGDMTEVVKRLDNMLVYLDSIQKLIEAHAPWRG